MSFRIAAVAFMCALSVPSSSHAQSAPRHGDISIAVGGVSLIPYLPLTLADRLGYFRDAGVSVKLNDFGGGAKSMQSLVGGSVDLAAGAYENSIYLQAKGINIATVALFTNSVGTVIGIAKVKAATYKSPKDLKGYKFGVTAPGSATNLALELFLAKGGLKQSDVSIIGVGAGAGAVAAMESGQIDGVAQVDPVPTKLLMDGVIVSLVDTRTQAGMVELYGGPIAATGVLATPSFIKERPAAMQAFAEAMVRTLKWMNSATLAQIMEHVPPQFAGGDREIYQKALAAGIETFSKDGVLPRAASENTYRVMAEFGRIPKSQKIDLDLTFNNAFVEQANKKN